MLAWIVKNPAWAIAGVLLVSCGLLFGLERYRAAKLDAARAELKVVQGNVEQALAANKNIAGALDQLKAAHDTLIATVRQDTAALERAAGAIQTTNTAIRAESGRLRAAREEIYRATPSCSELASIDIAAVCPALATSLREQSSRQGCASGGDPGSCPGAASF